MAAIVRLKFIAVILLFAGRQGLADDVGLYREGFKQFQAGDYISAGRSLSQLAPFTQEFGEHARYLLARVHDLSGERPEAIALYDAIIEYDLRCRGAAADALSRPQTLKDQPEEKARLERVLGEARPQYVVRSRFYSGRLLVEEGRFEDAVARLGKALGDADGVLGDETRLWLGVAQVQTKRFDEAIRNLSGLHEAEALRWLARAQVGLGVTPVQQRQNGAGILPSQQERKASFESAIEVLKKAVELQSSLRDSRGPDADEIRTMIELADLLRRAEHFDKAAEMYAEAAKGGGDSQLAEVARYRGAVALQLAGKYAEADAALEQFTAAFPKSGLLADAAVRYAEDALLARHFEEAMKRFAAVGDQYAKTEQAHLATLGVAGTQYQMGHLDEAVKIASQIPEGERLGDLSAANYLIGDCLLRKAPREAGDDALATARLIQDLSDLSDRFKSFVLAHDGDPRMVDASLKMGYCQQRMASLMAEPMERRKPLAAARRMYMGLLRQFPDHPLYPIMVLESARCTSQFGSRMAENELARFQYEPLKNSRLAPVALVRLGQVMRNTRRTDAAVKMLTQARADHEGSLMKDPARSAWAAALRYELGMALKEGGKYAEAQEILQSVLRDFPSDPRAAEIPWRIAQCQREAAMEQLLPNRKLFGRRDTAEQARITLAAGLEQMRQVAKVMAAEAKAKSPEPELAAQIAYEAGGCWRTVADFEAESARMAAQEEAQKQKVRGKQRALAPATKPAATQPAAAPGHDSQKEARACYRTILEIAPDSATAADARIALAELDQTGPARPLQLGRRRTSAVVVPTRTELPPVLNIDGNADFPKLEPFVRTASADLMDEETATLDDGLIDRTFSLPEEAIAIPAHQN